MLSKCQTNTNECTNAFRRHFVCKTAAQPFFFVKTPQNPCNSHIINLSCQYIPLSLEWRLFQCSKKSNDQYRLTFQEYSCLNSKHTNQSSLEQMRVKAQSHWDQLLLHNMLLYFISEMTAERIDEPLAVQTLSGQQFLLYSGEGDFIVFV